MPNMCKLAFVLKNKNPRANNALINPDKKYKYNSGSRSIVIPFFIKINNKIA